MTGGLHSAVVERCRKEGISIPFPQVEYRQVAALH